MSQNFKLQSTLTTIRHLLWQFSSTGKDLFMSQQMEQARQVTTGGPEPGMMLIMLITWPPD